MTDCFVKIKTTSESQQQKTCLLCPFCSKEGLVVKYVAKQMNDNKQGEVQHQFLKRDRNDNKNVIILTYTDIPTPTSNTQ